MEPHQQHNFTPVHYASNVAGKREFVGKRWFTIGRLVFRFVTDAKNSKLIELLDTFYGMEMTLKWSGNGSELVKSVVDCVQLGQRCDLCSLLLIGSFDTNPRTGIVQELEMNFELQTYEVKSAVSVYDQNDHEVCWKQLLPLHNNPLHFIVLSTYHRVHKLGEYHHDTKTVHFTSFRFQLDRKNREIFHVHLRFNDNQLVFLERDRKSFGSRNSIKVYEFESKRKRQIGSNFELQRKVSQLIATYLQRDHFYVVISDQNAEDQVLIVNLVSRLVQTVNCKALSLPQYPKIITSIDSTETLTIHELNGTPNGERGFRFRSPRLPIGRPEGLNNLAWFVVLKTSDRVVPLPRHGACEPISRNGDCVNKVTLLDDSSCLVHRTDTS
ncbi:hypothetical protein M3Y98_00737000 [Aphelenchoides besseyi]|nr:hypothetical protein M3Y98_00737000 [Aphelenchoides besseyi]KAI6211426.1 hypothetical protein M3Y96_00432900 [Aphelenchoides besseyi]